MVSNMDELAKELIKEYQERCNQFFVELLEKGPIENWGGDQMSWYEAFYDVVSNCRRASYDVSTKLAQLEGDE